MWDQTRYALEFFQQQLPFWEMKSRDELVDRGTCLALPGEVYAVYLPDGGTTALDLSGEEGTFSVEWYDPRNGGAVQAGSVTRITGGGRAAVGYPPGQPGMDWVCLIRATSP